MHDPTPQEYTPALTLWGHTWRLLGCLVISAFVWGQVVESQAKDDPYLFWLDLGLGAVSYVLMQYRRRWPLPVALAVNAMSLVSGVATGPATLVSVSVATRRVVWQVVLVGVVGGVAGQLYSVTQPGNTPAPVWWVPLGFSVVFTVAMMVSGMYIGSRRELLWTLRERARQAEAEQGLRMASARAAERERIAREMHDVLAHRISMVSMHAGALAFRTDLPPEQVRETAELIQTNAHEALTDLRQVLGVLRDDDPAAPDRPQPTLRDLPGLVEEARQVGMTVDLEQRVSAGVPEQAARTVYRIVQEGLTNARKHAYGAHVKVVVDGSPGEGLDVWVRNPALVGTRTSTPGAGLGLVGLRERAELAGGRLDVRGDAAGFDLHGWLPWPA